MEEETSLCSTSFGEILRAYRKRKRITQKKLAQSLGTHTNTISSWELGTYLPQTRGLVLEIARHLELNDQETRQLLEASLTALTVYWHLPFQRNPFFTGREEVLKNLHEHLSSSQASYVLHGLGGIGKTQTAVEYAYRYTQEYTAIFWIRSETPESIMSSFLAIATLLGLSERQGTDHSSVTATVHRWLHTHRQWLLIWDNVENFNLLSPYLPSTPQGAMLFTTRQPTLGTLAQQIELLPMKEQEGVLFLLRRARLLDPAALTEQLLLLMQNNTLEYAAARELVTVMDGLPLALDQVGAYIQEIPCSLAEYLKLYQTKGTALLKRRGEMVIDHPASVVTTWSISFEKIEQTNEMAAALLRICTFLHAEAIPEELFENGTALLSEPQSSTNIDIFSWHEAIRTASAYSLLKRHIEEHAFSIHRLVQTVLRDRMSDQERERWQRQAIHLLNVSFPAVTPDSRRQCERLLPHVLACAAAMPVQIRGRDLAEVLRKTADFLGEYTQDEPVPLERLVYSEYAPKKSDLLTQSEPGSVVPTLSSVAELAVQQASPYASPQILLVASESVVPTLSSVAELAAQQAVPYTSLQTQLVAPESAQRTSSTSTEIGKSTTQSQNDPGVLSELAAQGKRRSHFPVTQQWSRKRKGWWMFGYTLFGLICWLPYFKDTVDPVPAPFLTYLCILSFLIMPATVLFAGALFGARRGAVVSLFYTVLVIFLLILLSVLKADSSNVNDSLGVLIVCSWTWPLASLVTGWIYRWRLLQGFGRAYVTMLAGMSILGLGIALPTAIIGSLPAESAIDREGGILILVFLPFVIALLTLPMAMLEVIVQRKFEVLRKVYRLLFQSIGTIAAYFTRRKGNLLNKR